MPAAAHDACRNSTQRRLSSRRLFVISAVAAVRTCSTRVQVLVFPRSAATECLRLLAEALQALVQLNAGQVWRAAVPLPAHQGELQPAAA